MIAGYDDATYVGRVDYGHPSYRGATLFRRPMLRYYVQRQDGSVVGPLPVRAADRLLRTAVAIGAPEA